MRNTLFHRFGKSSHKILFLFELETQQFDYLNEAVESIWMMNRDEVMRSPLQLLQHIHPDDRKALLNRFGQLQQDGENQQVEFSLLLPNQLRKEVKLDAYALRNESGKITHIAGEVEDITKQSQYVDYLREYTRRKNSALEIIAHDLRGPLSLVKGVTSLLETEHREQNTENVSAYTDIIMGAYENCLNIISSLLSDEHLKSPQIYVHFKRFDIIGLVRKLLHSYQVAKGVDFTFELVTEEEKLVVELDEMKLMQVLNNLLSNSIKFTKSGGTISIEIRRESDQLLLIHKDNGIGIPEHLQPHVFERYSALSRKGLQGEITHGVGMSIVRELVEIQGGKIWFESTLNRGTTFYMLFRLPD